MALWEGGCTLKEAHGSYEVWRGTRRLEYEVSARDSLLWVTESIKSGRDKFLRFIHFVVGTGSRIRFWNDSWCSEHPLREVFPTLYASSTACYASVE